MARKFFNQKVKRKKKKKLSPMTIYIIIGASVLALLIAIILIIVIGNNNRLKNATIKVRDTVTVEVNSSLPDKSLFFEELKKVPEDSIKLNLKKVNLEKVGKYSVTIKIYGKKYISTLEVVDTESPTLTTKDLNLEYGSSYKASDFSLSCEDNSGTCNVEFYDMSVNQNGEKIDYSKYSEEGTYTILLVAKDDSGNASATTSATLTIGKKNVEIPKPTCNFGNNDYSEENIIAVDVTDNGCALDKSVYENETILEPVNKIVKDEEEKIKKEFSKINLESEDLYLNSIIAPVLNKQNKGLVGYSIKFEVSLKENSEVIESYFLTKERARVFEVNKYL